MNNREIETLLAPINVRVVCADELSAFVKNRPQSFVVNTDRCGKPGRHWTAFHFPSNGPAEFFDSLGQTPDHYDLRFRKVLIANGPSYLHLVDRVQVGIPTSAAISVSISFYSDIGEEPWRPSAVTFSSVVIIITMHLCELLHISKTIRAFLKHLLYHSFTYLYC